MPQLHVLGISEDGHHLLCRSADADGPASFTLPIDERLRAAIRGDTSRLGQLEIEMEPQLRPREIQRRVRAGASVEQVAAAAACSPDRIERYAYPVLMERASITEQARHVRPLAGAALGSAAAGRADMTLTEIAYATLTDRGQLQDPTWDAFRDERGWTVTLTWSAGHSENRAEWAYQPRVGGGTVTARNTAAADLIEPSIAPLRTVTTIGPSADDEVSGQGSSGISGRSPSKDPRGAMTSDEYLVAGTVTDERAGTRGARSGGTTERRTGAGGGAGVGTRVGAHGGTQTGTQAGTRTGTDDTEQATDGMMPGSQSAQSTAHGGTSPAGRSHRRGNHKPPMPSWEDVLLGTRSAQR